MMPQHRAASVLRFLLVPDAGAARRVRRLIAEQGACTGIVVGTWPELVEWARRSYLLPEAADDWDAVFTAALADLKDAFWAESFRCRTGGDREGGECCAHRGAVGDGARW